jgi:hypothetical protein
MTSALWLSLLSGGRNSLLEMISQSFFFPCGMTQSCFLWVQWCWTSFWRIDLFQGHTHKTRFMTYGLRLELWVSMRSFSQGYDTHWLDYSPACQTAGKAQLWWQFIVHSAFVLRCFACILRQHLLYKSVCLTFLLSFSLQVEMYNVLADFWVWQVWQNTSVVCQYAYLNVLAEKEFIWDVFDVQDVLGVGSTPV